MDIFGFKTQGVNYDKFRPRYPKSLIEKALTTTKNKGKYLDIATGTGYLLFQFAPHFLSSKGIDISKKMLDTASQKTGQFKTKYPEKKLELELKDVMEMSNQEKYDLITVGQALHYFPKIEPLQKIQSLLSQNGKFVAYGYIFNKVISKKQEEGEIFNRFYSKVKPYFTFNRDELHNHYTDKYLYPFQQVFTKVQRQMVEVPLEMNKLEYLSYLKTMSGYNLYLQKAQQDPLLEVENNCAEEITIVMEYFSISCTQV